MKTMIKKLIKKLVPAFLINYYHLFLAFLGALIYGLPSKKIKVIGVTGTNGKTTVVNLISGILEQAGFKTASLSSIMFKIGLKEWPNKLRMTMPGRFTIQKFLSEAVKQGCRYAILEVTSEGISQFRHKFIDFEAAIFTNLSLEHIEAHKGFENYRKAKGRLFESVKKLHIINLDDEQAGFFLQLPAENKYGYGIELKAGKDQVKQIVQAKEPKASDQGISFKVEDIYFSSRLLGEFNIYNCLAAIALGLSQGIDLKTCKQALEKVTLIPGRMEEAISSPFKVFVDYAFTPNALEKVYQSIKREFSLNKIICVLGACGGGRDKWKRPVLGEIASKYCDQVIITNEDPYDEDPIEIIEQVFEGTKGKAEKILDRREAIKKALSLASSGSAVVITGKGCEPSICLKSGQRMAWDDREVVKEEFNKLGK